MKATSTIRVVVILMTSWALYLLLGILLGSGFHTGPHDFYQLPGITIEHHYVLGWRIDEIRPVTFVFALGLCYLITWYLFRIASRFGKR